MGRGESFTKVLSRSILPTLGDREIQFFVLMVLLSN